MQERLNRNRNAAKSFFDLAKRFRAETDPEVVKRLGDELGIFVFGESPRGTEIPEQRPRRPRA